MKPDTNYGRSVFAPIQVHPGFAFELPVDESARYGQAETPLTVHPAWGVDLRAAGPVLQLELEAPAGASVAQLSTELFRLFTAMSDLEQSYGGPGLRFAEEAAAKAGPTPSNGKVQLSFRSTEELGAGERLRRLADAVNQEGWSLVGAVAPSFTNWRATVAC